MLAFLWALIDELDLDRRLAKYYMSLAFLSALLLAGIEAVIAYAHGVWMSGYVAGVGFLWIIISALTIWMRGGRALDGTFVSAGAGFGPAVTALEVLMGFYVVEGSVVLYFYLIPGTWNSVCALLVGIMGMYFTCKLKGRKFDWDWFFWPITVGVLITLFCSIAVATELIHQPMVPTKVGPWLRTNLHLGTGDLAYRLFMLSLALGGIWIVLAVFKRRRAGKFVFAVALLLFLAALGFQAFPEYQPEITPPKKLGTPAPKSAPAPPGLTDTGYKVPIGQALYITRRGAALENAPPVLVTKTRWGKYTRFEDWPKFHRGSPAFFVGNTVETAPIKVLLSLPARVSLNDYVFALAAAPPQRQ